jgi:ribosomal protein L16 Arg81 hydroxylase
MKATLGRRLFEPFGVDRFLREHWQVHQPFFMQSAPERLAEIMAVRQFASVKALLDSEPRQLKGWLSQGTKFSAVRGLSKAQAEKLWGTRIFTVVADHIDDEIPIVRELLESIRTELGYTVDCGLHANVYSSPPGIGNRAHFDRQEVIIFQLRGRKQWRFAPNRHLAFPVDSYFGHVGPLLAKQIDGALPDVMPDDARTVTLEPGSVLFLPRGTWHETKAAEEDSLAIPLTFSTKTWMALLGELLEDALIRRPELRRPVPPDLSDETHRALCAALAERARQAADALLAITPAQLALRHFGLADTARLRVAPGIALQDGEQGPELACAIDGEVVRRQVPREVGRLAGWLTRATAFTLTEALAVEPEACFASARFLRDLRAVGLLRDEPDAPSVPARG